MEYIKVLKAVGKWGLSARSARILCADEKIPSVIRKRIRYDSESAENPRDGRFKAPNIFEEIERKKELLSTMKSLT